MNRRSPESARQKGVRRAALFLGAVVAPIAIASFLAGSFLIKPCPCPVGAPPADFPAESVTFRNASGIALKGWFYEGEPGGGAVILLHGVHGSRLQMLPTAMWLAGLGYSVLLFDQQAHGESGGDAVTFGYRESQDATAAVAFVRARLPGEKIGVLGFSLGGAAILLASPPLPVDACIVESVYPTIEDAIHDRIALRAPWTANLLGPLLLMQFKPRLGFWPSALHPIAGIRNIRAPILVIAGTEDKHTPLTESQRLFDAAPEPKQFWSVSGAGHQDLFAFAGEEYKRRVAAFFASTLRGSHAP